MREHLLCPSTEGCHVLARPWSEPLADFAVEEFLALHGLFTRDARSGGQIDDASSPLGNSEETEAARARMRHSTGPSPVKRPMSEAVASRIGSRLVAGTLHEILCEGRDREALRRAIVALEEASPPAGLTEEDTTGGRKDFFSRRPHALLMRFPGATAANGGGPLAALGAKAGKKWLRSCVRGTWLDPDRDDETDGRGSSGEKIKKRVSGSGASGGTLSRSIQSQKGPERRAHACVAWVETRRAFCLTRPVAAEAALRYVRACATLAKETDEARDEAKSRAERLARSAEETNDDDDAKERETSPTRGRRAREDIKTPHRAAPAAPALAAVVANLARIQGHSLVFDPFAGTGGLLVPAIALGAPFALGADVRAESANVGVRDAVAANAHASPLRGTRRRRDDLDRRDDELARPPRARRACLDAIVCDPPYGLRAPRIARGSAREKDALCADAGEMERATRVFCMRPVFRSATRTLRVGGRLVFLAPTHRSRREARVFGAAQTEGDRGADLAARRARRGSAVEPFRGGKTHRARRFETDEGDDADAEETVLAREFPGLRFVGACAQEFKGMTRSARVFERVAAADDG